MSQANAILNVRDRDFLIGSVDMAGNWSVSTRPNFHGTQLDAEREAKRLSANSSDGKLFVVLGIKGAARRPVQVAVETF